MCQVPGGKGDQGDHLSPEQYKVPKVGGVARKGEARTNLVWFSAVYFSLVQTWKKR